MTIVWTALGGFFGSIARYYCSRLWKRPGLNTWIVNVLGSLLLGIFVHLHINHLLSTALFSLLGVGFCGAFTTFSTFGYETTSFLLDKRYGMAIIYVCTMITVSFLIVYTIANV